MLTVRLHGHLEEKFGSEFKFEASSVREVIDALQANFDDFTEEFIKDERAYNILVDYEMQDINGCVLPVKTDSVIDIVPVILGAGFLKSLGLIIVGALLIIYAPALVAGFQSAAAGLGFGAGFSTVGAFGAGLGSTALLGTAGAAAASAITAIGWSLALAGVASLLAGPDGPDGGGEQSSSLNQTENIVGQGMPVPIGYGRMLVGSAVLSATSTSSYIKTSKSYTYNNTAAGWWADYTIPISQAIGRDLGAFTAADGFVYPAIPIDYGAGLAPQEEATKIQNAERDLGGLSYEIVNYLYASGDIRPAVALIPVNYNGVYS